MKANVRMVIILGSMLCSALIQAKGHYLAVRNDTGWNLRINYVLYLPQWKKAHVRLMPHTETVVGDASQMKIDSVSASHGLRSFLRPTPVIDMRYLAKAMKNAREYRAQKQGTTIVFYMSPNKAKIYSIAVPEFKNGRKTEMRALAVKRFSK